MSRPLPRARVLAILAILALFTIPAAPAIGATLAVANKSDATLSLVDLRTGTVVATLATGAGPHEVGVSPDGRRLLVSNYGGEAPGSTLTLIDLPTAEVVKTIDLAAHRRPHGVVWLDLGRALVTAEDSGALLEVDVERASVTRSMATGQEVSHMVVATPDGRRAFVANIASGSVTVIDLASGAKKTDVPTGGGAEGIALAAGGKELWVTNRDSDTLTVLDADSLERRAEIRSEGFPIRATATSTGLVLVSHARGGHLGLFSAANRAETGRVSFDLASLGGDRRLFADRFGNSSVPIGVVVSSDGALAYVAHANADAITEVDLAAKRVVRTLRAGREPDGMAWSAVDVERPATRP